MYYVYLLFSQAFNQIYVGSANSLTEESYPKSQVVAIKKNLIKIQSDTTGAGFTLIELMVVISIMAILALAMSINLAGQRARREIQLAQNKLVSDIRKVQSYNLSARILPSGQAAQYYLLKFDLSKPKQYTIQAIFNASSQPALEDVETVALTSNIQFAATSLYPITVARALASTPPAIQPIYTGCALAAFAAPFGKIIFNDGCLIAAPPQIDRTNPNDDYNKIISFQTNVACDGNNGDPPNPLICSASTDSVMTITLMDTARTASKNVIINAITGAVSFN